MHTDGRNLWLDLIRGCSALIVCLGHLRNAILVDYSALIHPNIAIKVFYVLTSLGHQAVMVFFVLSGYFVGGGVLRAGAKFSWGNYLTARLTRLWVVLIPCLFITWAIGLIIGHYSPSVLAGANIDSWHSGPKLGEYSTSLGTLLANILFMQTIISPVFGLNSPLWSLANEFWYYMLFPLLLVASGTVRSAKYLQRAVAFFVAIILVLFLPSEMVLGFLIWLLGVAVYCLQAKVKAFGAAKIYLCLLMTLVLFGCALGFSKSAAFAKFVGIESDFAVGLAFALVCLVLTQLPLPTQRWSWFAKSALHLSEISYSLYLSHFPIVILIASTVYASRKFVPNSLLMAQFVGWSALLLIFGSVLWRLFESRTAIVRAKVNTFLNLGLVKLS